MHESKLEKAHKAITSRLCETYPEFNSLINLVQTQTEIYPCLDDNVLYLLTELGYSGSTIQKLKSNHNRSCKFIGTDPGWIQDFRFLVFQFQTRKGNSDRKNFKNSSPEMLVCHLKEPVWSVMFSLYQKAMDKLLKLCIENESLITDFRIIYSDILASVSVQIIGPESIRDDLLNGCILQTALTWMLQKPLDNMS